MHISIREAIAQQTDPRGDIRHILSAVNVALPKKISAAVAALETVKAITEKRIHARSFDFDGVKYDHSEAERIALALEEEIKQQQERLKKVDRQVISWFLNRAKEEGEPLFISLREKYTVYFNWREKAATYLDHINLMLTSLNPIFSGQTIPIENIRTMIGTLTGEHEPVLKRYLRDWKAADVYRQDAAGLALMEKFCGSSYEYFSGRSFFDEELTKLNKVCHESWDNISLWLFGQFKSTLEDQAALLKKQTP